MEVVDYTLLKKIIQPRSLNSHKGDYGRLLLIGGTYPFGGAIIMAALAAVHSGAGLVTVATDRKISQLSMLIYQKQWLLMYKIKSY